MSVFQPFRIHHLLFKHDFLRVAFYRICVFCIPQRMRMKLKKILGTIDFPFENTSDWEILPILDKVLSLIFALQMSAQETPQVPKYLTLGVEFTFTIKALQNYSQNFSNSGSTRRMNTWSFSGQSHFVDMGNFYPVTSRQPYWYEIFLELFYWILHCTYSLTSRMTWHKV